MNYSEAIRFSLQSLRANRLRTFLTGLGLVIGNASVILVVTISLVGKDLILDRIRNIGSNLVYASYETGGQTAAKVEADFVKLADLEAIRESLGADIVAAAPVIPNNDRIVVNGKERDVTIIGTDQYYAKVRNMVIFPGGRAFVPSDITLRERVAMVTEKLAKVLYGSTQAAVGQTVRISRLQFVVIGVFREKTTTFGLSEMTDETILIPVTVMKYFIQYERVDPLYLQVRYADQVPYVTAEVKRILETRHRPGAKYNVQNLKAILDTANFIAIILTLVLIVVCAIALIISGIGIMNIMLVTVTERTREIGLRKAVGASRKEILGQFLTEAIMISTGGGSIGILIGVAIPLGVSLFTDIKIPVSPYSILIAFAVSASVGIGFGILPASRAASMNPTEALRYE